MRSPEKFADALTEAVYVIKAREKKKLEIIQDELGYALGRENGSFITYLRKGNIPTKVEDVKRLAELLVQRRGLDRKTCRQFLIYSGYHDPKQLLMKLFLLDGQPVENTSFSSSTSSFVVGPPVIQLSQFFGREYEASRIFSLWQNFPFQHIAIVGPKYSGKTSLLHYISKISVTPKAQLRSSQRNDWLPQAREYCWILVDFRDARLCHLERLLRYLLIGMELEVPEPCDLENFLDMLDSGVPKPTIILFDEFRRALSAPELTDDLWSSLHALVSQETGGNLSFVLTASEEIFYQMAERDELVSFLNLFQKLKLGPLAEKDARELIASSPQTFAPDEIEWILQQSKLWPSLLKILCQARLHELDDVSPPGTWQEEGLRQIERFRYLLD